MNGIDRRLEKIAAALATADNGARVLYCSDDREAEEASRAARNAGQPAPLCIVTGYSGDGGTLGDVMAAVAVEGRRIHDPLPEGWLMPAGYLWPSNGPKDTNGI